MTKYDPKHAVFLDSEERKDRMPPNKIIDLMDLQESEKVLDLGAGTGYLSLPLSKEVKEGKVFAVDVQNEMLEVLKDKCEERDCERIEILLSEEDDIPLPDNKIDKAFLVNVLHEIDDFKTLVETRRVLKKKGQICVVDWDKEVTTESGPPTHERFSLTEATEKLEEYGFEISRTGKFEDHFWFIGENNE